VPSPSLVSVVIPTRDGEATLGEVLGALFAQRPPFPFEVVIVDSGSRDSTLEIARRHPVHLHRIPAEEFDHGETRNLGIRLAGGDPVALLTQDATPASTDFLEHLVRPFEDRRVAGVYGRQIPRIDCDVVTRRQLERWLTGRREPALALLEADSLEHLSPLARLELCTFDNVCSALRRTTWEKTPFPGASFGEDIAWGKAVITDGWAIAYEPRAAVLHSHRRSVAYEWSRTRLCHRRLFELFELATVPRARDVARASLANLRHDLPIVLRDAPPGVERLRQLARVAALSIASPLAQHLGARDSRRLRRAGA
jgi:rhamnosyltransferase